MNKIINNKHIIRSFDKIEVVFKQLWNFVIKAKYPCIKSWDYWEFGFVNYECKYYHIKTLVSYLKKRKNVKAT